MEGVAGRIELDVTVFTEWKFETDPLLEGAWYRRYTQKMRTDPRWWRSDPLPTRAGPR